jgi:hypothetical protein
MNDRSEMLKVIAAIKKAGFKYSGGNGYGAWAERRYHSDANMGVIKVRVHSPSHAKVDSATELTNLAVALMDAGYGVAPSWWSYDAMQEEQPIDAIWVFTYETDDAVRIRKAAEEAAAAEKARIAYENSRVTDEERAAKLAPRVEKRDAHLTKSLELIEKSLQDIHSLSVLTTRLQDAVMRKDFEAIEEAERAVRDAAWQLANDHSSVGRELSHAQWEQRGVNWVNELPSK